MSCRNAICSSISFACRTDNSEDIRESSNPDSPMVPLANGNGPSMSAAHPHAFLPPSEKCTRASQVYEINTIT